MTTQIICALYSRKIYIHQFYGARRHCVSEHGASIQWERVLCDISYIESGKCRLLPHELYCDTCLHATTTGYGATDPTILSVAMSFGEENRK